MPTEFRSDLKGLWHSSSDCRYWPANSFNVLRTLKLPRDFNHCPECKALTAIDAFVAAESPGRSLRPRKF